MKGCVVMIITRADGAINNVQSEQPHSIIKNTSVNGVSQQRIKGSSGTFINSDYDLLHSIDL